MLEEKGMLAVTIIIFGVIFLAVPVTVIDCKHLTYTNNQTLNKILMKQCIGLDIGEGD